MRENYKLIKLNNEPYSFLVVATSSISPLSCLDDIIADINCAQANVLFDLTLINGINSNRYLQGLYSCGSFKLDDFTVVKDINTNIKTISCQFF